MEQLGMEEEEVVPAASFVDDLGVDSLGLIELIIFLEEEFSSPSRKIEIPDENVEKIVTVQDMVDYLQDLGVEDEEMITEFSFKPLWLRLEVAQKRLIDELERLKTDNCLVAETLRSSSWAKEDELANLISELEKRRALEKRLREQLAEIEHALRKKDQGTYGLCDNCGQPIDLGRLDALPQANLCLNCKAHEEGSKR